MWAKRQTTIYFDSYKLNPESPWKIIVFFAAIQIISYSRAERTTRTNDTKSKPKKPEQIFGECKLKGKKIIIINTTRLWASASPPQFV